jgi:hypothetical protein
MSMTKKELVLRFIYDQGEAGVRYSDYKKADIAENTWRNYLNELKDEDNLVSIIKTIEEKGRLIPVYGVPKDKLHEVEILLKINDQEKKFRDMINKLSYEQRLMALRIFCFDMTILKEFYQRKQRFRERIINNSSNYVGSLDYKKELRELIELEYNLTYNLGLIPEDFNDDWEDPYTLEFAYLQMKRKNEEDFWKAQGF